YSEPRARHELMQRFAELVGGYLAAQARAGAGALQLFDSWVGCLSPADYATYVFPHSQRALELAGASGVPVIHFGTDTATLLVDFARAGGDVIGVDWRVPIDVAWERIGMSPSRAIQGNLDPVALLAPRPELERQVRDVLARAAVRPGDLVNLGLVLAPHYSAMSVGAYEKQLVEAAAGRLEPALVRSWGDHPKFLDAVAGRVARALERFPTPGSVQVLFTAHSLPERILATGDPYPDDLRASAAAVAKRVGLASWRPAFPGADVVVLDAGRQPGGMSVTERRDGFIVEGGPDGFLAAEPDIQELAREVGIGERLVDQVARGATVWTGRRFEPLAEGKAAELLGIQANPLQSAFRSFAAGMADMVDALVACLSSRPRLRTTQGVTAV